MRVLACLCVVGLGLLTDAAHAEVTEREELRKSWHRCLRQSFSGQPSSLGQQAAERAALAACKPAEDAHVAAELAAQSLDEEARRRDSRSLTSRARAVLASVTAYVVEPVTTWFGAFRR